MATAGFTALWASEPATDRDARPPEIRPAVGAALFVGFVLVWFIYGIMVDAGKSLDGDTVEAYVWGREFRLGYNQHPPFWAWLAGAWFLVFPNQNWAFHLLPVVNSAVGLLGCWCLVGLFAAGWTRIAAFNLLLLTPFYTFLCYKYNANSIFLSLWPWTLYFLFASIATRDTGKAVCFGVLMAAALLSKYYAITLALVSLAASLLHPGRRAYYRSAAPYLSALVCALLVLPHAVWLVEAQAPPVAYIWARTGMGLLAPLRYAGELAGAVALFHVPAALVVLAAAYPTVRFEPGLWRRERVLIVLALGPLLLTILFGLAFELKVSSNMMIGTFPLLPLLLVRIVASARPQRIARLSGWLACGIAAAALLASPAIAYIASGGHDPAAMQPRQELAAFATRLWREQTGTKLRLVAGVDPYENAIGFYSADRPRVFIGFGAKAPWITPTMLERDGLLIVCPHPSDSCKAEAAPFLSPRTRRFTAVLAHGFWGRRREPVGFDLLLVPPRGDD